MTEEERAAFDALLEIAPPGPRIEFGVRTGWSLALIADHGGATIGVDTFTGMPEPGKRDIKDGWNPYPKGRLAASMECAAKVAPGARLVRGCVPAILADIGTTGFAFAHLDMDHFDPTLAALEWLWPRMCSGGIICCDDWFPDRDDWLASGAIHAFVARVGKAPETAGRKAWWTL